MNDGVPWTENHVLWIILVSWNVLWMPCPAWMANFLDTNNYYPLSSIMNQSPIKSKLQCFCACHARRKWLIFFNTNNYHPLLPPTARLCFGLIGWSVFPSYLKRKERICLQFWRMRIQDPDLWSGSDLYRTDFHANFTRGVSEVKDHSTKFWGWYGLRSFISAKVCCLQLIHCMYTIQGEL